MIGPSIHYAAVLSSHRQLQGVVKYTSKNLISEETEYLLTTSQFINMQTVIWQKKRLRLLFSADNSYLISNRYAAQGSLLFPGTLSHDDEDCYLVNVFGCCVL